MSTVIETLLTLHLEEFTGKVVLKKDQVEKTIFFKKGDPIFVDSSIRSETLGQMLLSQNRLTEEQYREVIETMTRTQKRQGEVIVQLGFLSGFDVYEALKEQGARKVQNCFLLEGAEIETSEGEIHLKEVPELPIPFFRVFVDSISTTYLGSDAFLFSPEKALLINEKGKNYLKKQSLAPQEARLTNFLNGKYNEETILTKLNREDAEPLLLAFHQLGFVDEIELPPQRFTIPASQAKPIEEVEGDSSPNTSESSKRIVKIAEDEEELEEGKSETPTNPIYLYALRLNQPYHELLGIRPTANKFEIKRQFESLVRKLKLDTMTRSFEGRDLEIANKVFDRLSLAYTVLADDRRRHEYFQAIAKRKPQDTKTTPEIQAEACVQKAQMYMGGKDFSKAEEEIRKAIELVPKESSFHVELAQLILQKAVSEKREIPGEVETELKEALKLNSADADAFYKLGEIYKIGGDFEKAMVCFQRAIDHRPSHAKAMAELRLLNMRLESKKSESSFMKLFKKKDS